MLTITLNGSDVELDAPVTVRELIEQRGLASVPCAVEVNTELVPRAKHADHLLGDGDRVEIVTLVGGG